MKKIMVALLLAVVAFTGCDSAVYKLFYNSLGFFIYRAITGFVDPNPDQERFLKEKIESHLLWHRRAELPKYVTALQSFRGRMAAGLTPGDMKWMHDQFDLFGTDLFNRISDDVVTFMLSLDRTQIDRLDLKIAESIDKMEKESAADNEKRIQDMERSTIKFLEFMYGDLSAKQKDEVSRGVRQLESIEPERVRLYRERRVEFIALLRQKPERNAFKDYIGKMFLKPERSYPAYYRERAERRDRTIADGFLRFDRDLVTSEQRAHAVKKIDLLIQVLRELSQL